MGKVSLLSLGCPKNLVDSEKLLNRLREKGIYYSSNPDESDLILINTCGFIEAAQKESVNEILKLAKYKGKNRKKKLIVFGCLAQRYKDELRNEIPEIDALWGVGKEEEIVEYCSKMIDQIRNTSSISEKRAEKQIVSDEKFNDRCYAYLKIAEGCDKTCSYCVIPKIRGEFKSRAPEKILREAEDYINSGAKELVLIAQDITSYGKGINGYDLNRLIKELASIGGDFRIRLLYLYPISVTDELLETIQKEEKICKYIDIPLQHSEDRILRLMGRGGSREYYKKIISRIRLTIPGVNIRTSFIVGFPGETEEDFQGLEDFIQEVRFERLGVFTYSREEGTPAFRLKGHLSKHIKEKRYRRIMEIQSSISLEKNRELIGKTFRALVDDAADDVTIARIYSQAPEIDGVVFIKDRNVEKGDFVNVKIVNAYDYDLEGVVVR